MIKFFSLLILIIFNSCVPIEKETEKFIKKNSQLSFKQNNRIVDFQISDNKKYKAFSVLENKKINIYVVEKLKKKKIKNNIKYKKILKIDDFGNVFYTSTGVNPHYPANSYVFINESKLDVNPGTHIDLILNQKGDYIWKFFHYKQKNNFFYIYHYNSQEDKINYINFKSFPTHIAFCNNEIIKIITNNLKLNETRYYDLKKKKFLKDKIDCNFKKIFKKKPLLITSRGDHNSYQKKLIDSINDTFFNNDPLGNLSLLDNNEGRISWHISKKLEGLIFLNEMYNKKVIDINRNIDIEKLVKKYINNILKSHNISNNYSGWATTKYSRNKDTKLYLSVDNASIFYPLLLGVNSKLGLSTFKKKKILKYFDIFFNNHEVNFNKKKKFMKLVI